MKDSMLNDLYFGEYRPWERGRVPGREYDALARKISDLTVYFENQVSPKDAEKLRELQNLRSEANLMEDFELFKSAFCAGAQLMIEIFSTRLQ